MKIDWVGKNKARRRGVLDFLKKNKIEIMATVTITVVIIIELIIAGD